MACAFHDFQVTLRRCLGYGFMLGHRSPFVLAAGYGQDRAGERGKKIRSVRAGQERLLLKRKGLRGAALQHFCNAMHQPLVAPVRRPNHRRQPVPRYRRHALLPGGLDQLHPSFPLMFARAVSAAVQKHELRDPLRRQCRDLQCHASAHGMTDHSQWADGAAHDPFGHLLQRAAAIRPRDHEGRNPAQRPDLVAPDPAVVHQPWYKDNLHAFGSP